MDVPHPVRSQRVGAGPRVEQRGPDEIGDGRVAVRMGDGAGDCRFDGVRYEAGVRLDVLRDPGLEQAVDARAVESVSRGISEFLVVPVQLDVGNGTSDELGKPRFGLVVPEPALQADAASFGPVIVFGEAYEVLAGINGDRSESLPD